MKSITLLLVFVCLTLPGTSQTSARFEDFEVAIYRGTIHRPRWMRRIADNVTDLVTRANSKLLVAQFHIDLPRGDECRERTFILEDEKLTAVQILAGVAQSISSWLRSSSADRYPSAR